MVKYIRVFHSHIDWFLPDNSTNYLFN